MSRWGTGSSGRATQGDQARAALDGAVAAFLDLDSRQRFVSEAVDAAVAVEPAVGLTGRSPLEAGWDVIEQRCFAVSGQYLAVAQQYPAETSASSTQMAAAAYHQVHTQLAQASADVDAFYHQHRESLDRARMAVSATPNLVRTARQTAANALERALTHPEVSGYRSVLKAQQELDRACDVLDRATAIADVRAAVEQVTRESAALDAAVDEASKAGDTARTSLSSVRTRIDSLITRTERLADTNSALLREFAAASTRDLTQNIGQARQHLAEGEADWQHAKEHLASGDAESAVEALHSARQHLAESDAAGKALTDRLSDLRQVRDDPDAAMKQARFKVRDAQRLVVDRNLVGEWGTVLDSQMARLDRAIEGLTGVHPNYWAYLGELRSVTAFVGDVVDRVRHEVSGR